MLKNCNLPKCEKCGTRLEMRVVYTGADWDCAAGEGSGFGFEVELMCPDCGSVYTICHCKEINHISEHICHSAFDVIK